MKKALSQKWFRQIFRRRVLVIFLLLVQLIVIAYLIFSSSKTSQIISSGFTALSVLTALYIVSKHDKGAYKLTWIFQILLFPLFGGLFYLLFTRQTSTKKFAKRIKSIENKTHSLFYLPEDGYDDAVKKAPNLLPQIHYLQKHSCFPVYTNSTAHYLASGEEKLEALKIELAKAKHYIFLEYFIVEEGVMWNEILEILKRKASSGVIVRLIYDDLGCFLTLPQNYSETLKTFGIECAVFNPFKPILTVKQNNRDHRKIIVVDGQTAFTGGINLADEYINAKEKYGHWKDAAIMIKGKAAWSFTLMFLQMWELCKNVKEDFSVFFPEKDTNYVISGDGFIQPYADSPVDSENVGEHVYLQIINNAKEYLYIYTPYLIIDDDMITALTLAAKSGVDVRIITPHVWDKWVVHMATRSYYRELIHAGVKIYEYSKGFLHAKVFVSDDTVATVGTTNLDFRSLYLHFECGTCIYNSSAIYDIKTDFLNTLSACQQIKEEDCSKNVFMRLFQDILRLFAPLM